MTDGGREIGIMTPFIRLDALLKLSGVCGSGGQAKALIQAGQVKVNGSLCVERGKKLYGGDTAQIEGDVLRVTAEKSVPPDEKKEKKDT